MQRWQRRVVFAIFLFASNVNSSANEYLVNGLTNYSPYWSSVLNLRFDDGSVTGSLSPLRGGKAQEVQITGKNVIENELVLEFHTSPSFKLSFQKTIQDDLIVWENEDAYIRFSRPRRSAWSEAALTISQASCGPIYGSVSVQPWKSDWDPSLETSVDTRIWELPSGYYSYDELLGEYDFISATFLEVLQRNLAYVAVFVEEAEVEDEDHNVNFSIIDGNPTAYQFFGAPVPVGSELYVVSELRKLASLRWVNLTKGACGGSEQSYFTMDRDPDISKESILNIQLGAVLKTALYSFFESSNLELEFFVSDAITNIVQIPTMPTHYKFNIVGSSVATRGVPGFWDKFTLHLEPFLLMGDINSDFAMNIFVSKLRSAKRLGDDMDPPFNDEWYKIEHEESDEIVPTVRLANFLSSFFSGTCLYDAEGYEPKNVVSGLCEWKY